MKRLLYLLLAGVSAASAQTSMEIVQRVNREINAVLQLPDVRERMAAQYMEPAGGTPKQLEQFLDRELRTMAPVIRRSGATVE